MTALSVQLGVLAVADDPAKGGRADIESVTARATAAGHLVVARSSVNRQPAAIADRLSRWLDDPEIDVIIVTGVPSTVVGAALDPDKVQAVSGVADGVQCGSTFVFSISASGAGPVATVMNSRILHLLDARRPGNLVSRFPRLAGIPVRIKPEKTQDGFAPNHRMPATPADRATPVPIRAQPLPPERASDRDTMTRPVDRMTPFPEGIATTVDKPPGIVTTVGPMPDAPTKVGPAPTADGKSPTTNVGPAPAPKTSIPSVRSRPRTGANVIARRPAGQVSDDPATAPLDISELDEHIAASSGRAHTDVTKPVDLEDVMPSDAVADEDDLDLDEPIEQPAPAPAKRPPVRPTPPPPRAGTEPPAKPMPTGPARSAQMTPPPPEALKAPTQHIPPAARQPTPPVPMPVVRRPSGSNPPITTPETESGPITTASTSQPLPPSVAAVSLPAAPPGPRRRAPSAPPMDFGGGPPLRSKRDTLFVNKDAGKISPWKLILSALVGAGIVSAALYFLGNSNSNDKPTTAKAPVPVDAAVVAVVPPDAAEAIAPPVDAMEIDEIEFDVPTGPDPKNPTDPKDPKDSKKPRTPKDAGVDQADPAPTPDAAVAETDPDRDPSIDPANDCDEAGCVLGNYDRECCAKYKPKTTGFKPTPTGPADTLDKAAVKAGIAKIKARVTSCGEKTAVKGTVKIAVSVSPAGDVTDASVSEAPDATLGSCVATAVKAAKFATTTNGGNFTVPFVF